MRGGLQADHHHQQHHRQHHQYVVLCDGLDGGDDDDDDADRFCFRYSGVISHSAYVGSCHDDDDGADDG